jgi:hypothetical protein
MFALDTVFVIDFYEELDNDGKFPGWKSDLHRKITIDLIDIPKCGLKFYGGKTWSLDRPFSFVPCRPATPHANGFGRPLIEPSGILKDVITPKLLQGYKITEFGDNKRADAAWDALVTQVVNQNCYLGTLVDEPTWHA